MKKLSALVLFIALTACTERSELPRFDLEAAINNNQQLPDTFILNDIVEIVNIIPIETQPDALIGTARLLYIGKEHYYVLHENKISRIDHSGKIVNTIARRGRGPEEYLQIVVADVNEDDSTIRVFDQRGDKYITYDMDGNFIDKGSLSNKGIEIPRFISSDYMVVRGSRDSSFRHYITDRDMNILQGLFPTDKMLSATDRWALSQQVAVGSGSNAALINLATEDTLYRVTKQGMTPEAILYKGKYRRSETPVIQIVTRDSQPYLTSTAVTSFGDYYFIRQMLGVFFVLEIWNKSTGELLAYSDNRENLSLENVGLRFNLPSGGTTSISSYHVDGDTMAFVVNALDVEGVKEDDNPIIVVTKLKR